MKNIPVVSQTDTVIGKGAGPVYCYREVADDGENIIPAAVSAPKHDRFFGVYLWDDDKEKWTWVADVATQELALHLTRMLAGTTRAYVPDAMALTFAHLAIGYQVAFINMTSERRLSGSWDDILNDLLWQGHIAEEAFFGNYLPRKRRSDIEARYGNFVSFFGREFVNELMTPTVEGRPMHRAVDDILQRAWESIQ